MSAEINRLDGVSRRTVLKASAVAVGGLGMSGTAAADSRGMTKQVADVSGQGPGGPIVAEDGATLRRTDGNLSMRLSMPTPEPGSYTYPSGPEGGPWTDEEGPPEVFTLWCFYFPPEQDSPGGDWTGVYAAAGHVVGGPRLTLSSGVSAGASPFLGDPLEHPGDAPVRLAVAPHGALDPDLLPDALRTPTGPGPDIWWIAEFDSP